MRRSTKISKTLIIAYVNGCLLIAVLLIAVPVLVQ